MKFAGIVGRLFAVGFVIMSPAIASLGLSSSLHAQAPVAPPVAPVPSGAPLGTAGNAGMQQADALAAAALAAPSATADAALPPAPKPEINLWQLANDGGPLMYPIYAMSIFVVCYAFERAFGMRRRRLLPPGLVSELGELSKRSGGVDPRAAYRACQRYPSTAATVLKAVLLKIGRPFAELELTLKEANER